jgi:hypothetical protein
MATNVLGNQVKLGSNRKLVRVTGAFVALALAVLGAKFFILDQQHYLVPSRAVAPGEPLNRVSWNTVNANLGNLASHYLPADHKPQGYALQALSPGQLVPLVATARLQPGTFARLVVTTKTQLGQGIRTGAKVAIWASEKLQNNQFDAPKRIVANAVVARVLKQQAMFSSASQQVELMVAPIQTPIVLSAVATDSAIFLVSQQ